MSTRVRLTKRAADGSIPYPGNVNQPGRKDPAMDEYHTFEQQVNHELPDMRHEWKDDDRDDIGFGIPGEGSKAPTVASVRVAANKAVRIAVLLLGEKVEDEVIEAQARDLMTLSASAMDRTLARFADTQKLYAEEEKVEEKDAKCAEDKAEEKKEEKVEEKVEAKKAEEKVEDKAEKKAEEKTEDKAEKKAEDKKMPDFIKEKIEDKKEDKKASDDKDEDDAKVEAKKAEDKAEEKSEEKEEKKASTEMDIELSAAADEDEEEMDAETASQLASLFEGNDGRAATEDVEQKPDASKKAGIKKLGGQPRVAGTNGSNVADISSIWNSAPDVSELFR